jgi:hypothetical protein
MINRDDAEKYAVVVTNGGLQVWDINGNQKTVSFPNGTGYLTSSLPRSEFSIVTIQDYTIMVNKTKTAAMSAATTSLNPTNTVYFYVCSAPAQHSVYATVDGIEATAALGTSGGTQGGLATTLATNLTTALGANYTITRPQPEIIKVVKNTGAINSFSCKDTYGNFAIRCLNAGVQRYAELPAKFEDNFVVTINGDPESYQSVYYVKFVTAKNTWVETSKPGTAYAIDPSTMPHKLVRNADGTFTFGQITWDGREVGDPAVSENPSFIGRKISDVFFFRNRLGFLADENVIFSKAGEFFNFFPSTVTQVLDTDPVDAAVSHIKVSNLRHAIPFNKNLVLFSDLTQFMVTANDLLTPKTVAIHQTTEFECSRLAKPVALGSNVYFAVEKTGYTGIREYYVMPYQQTYDADDVTAHVPRYLPGAVFKLVASTNEDTLFALSLKERSTVYVYKFYWKGEEKIQSSWSKWKLDPADIILSMELIGTKLFLLIQRTDGLYLEYIDLQVGLLEDDLPILVCLDRKVKQTGSYNASANTTTWTLPYSETNVQLIYNGAPVTVTRPNATTLVALGNYSAKAAYIGRPYTFRYRFSAQYVKDQGNNSIAQAELKLRVFKVFYTNTGYFRAEVTPKARDTFKYPFTAKLLGDVSATLGSVSVDSGVFAFPVLTDAATGKVDLVNDSYLPCFFQSAEWEGFFSLRSQRM